MRLSLLIALFLAGCTLGPKHKTPDVCLPCHYSEAPCEAEEVDLSVWWEQFDDPILEGLIKEALCCNYDLRIALHKIEEVRALYKIDRSDLYPQIQGNWEAMRARRSENLSSDVIESAGSPTELIPTDFSGPLIQYFFQIGFDASWELDFFGKNRKKAQAARHDFEASQEEALGVQITMISDVARNYINFCALEEQIKAQERQIQRQEDLVCLSEVRFNAGLTSYLEVTKAQAELDSVKTSLPPLVEAKKNAQHAIAILLGKPPEFFCLEQTPMPMVRGIIPNDMPSDLLLRRPDLRKADRELAAATARIGQAKAELFPSFSLLSAFGTQSNALNKLFVWPSRYWTVGPVMIWNLFTGGKLRAQVEVTNERQKQAILSYEKAVNDALKDVEDRLVGYFEAENTLEALESKLATNSLTRDLTYDRYVSGLISFDDVLDTEKEFFATELEMIQSKDTMMTQLVGLYKALGGGWQCSTSH